MWSAENLAIHCEIEIGAQFGLHLYNVHRWNHEWLDRNRQAQSAVT